MKLRIAGGRVYDPANGVAGEVRDVCLDDGTVVPDLPADAMRIDARGMVVMPGGVDIHAHIAGPKVNAARRLLPEEHRADVHDRSALMRSGQYARCATLRPSAARVRVGRDARRSRARPWTARRFVPLRRARCPARHRSTSRVPMRSHPRAEAP